MGERESERGEGMFSVLTYWRLHKGKKKKAPTK